MEKAWGIELCGMQTMKEVWLRRWVPELGRRDQGASWKTAAKQGSENSKPACRRGGMTTSPTVSTVELPALLQEKVMSL